MLNLMRFLAFGCVGILCLAGCGDSGSGSGKAGGGAGDQAALDPSKVKIEDITPGTGKAAANGDTLAMQYTGKLVDGTVFDSTAKRDNAPFQFVLGKGQVIKGWDQGLVGMKEGGTRKLTIPSALAYGATPPQSSPIPANADLVFEVKLDKVLEPDDLDKVGIKVVKEGTGPAAKDGDTLEVDYAGTLLSGVAFDSTKAQGGKPLPVTLGAHQVVAGFEAALDGMKVGGERIATIPPPYGYGPQPMGKIPPNSWLVFDLKLVSLKPGAAKK
jgi:peptidylprolyl isomerase